MNSVCRKRLMHSSAKGMQWRISLQGACHLPLAKVTCALTGLPPEIRQGPRCQTWGFTEGTGWRWCEYAGVDLKLHVTTLWLNFMRIQRNIKHFLSLSLLLDLDDYAWFYTLTFFGREIVRESKGERYKYWAEHIIDAYCIYTYISGTWIEGAREREIIDS